MQRLRLPVEDVSPVYRLPEPSQAATARFAPIREADARDADTLARAMGIPPERVIDRMTQHRRCYLAELDGQIASYGWLSFGAEDVPELETTVHPSLGEAYLWDCLTLPVYRGLGLLPSIIRHIVSELPRLRASRMWAVILADNKPSERAFRKAGFVLAARVTYLRLLGLRRRYLSPTDQAPPILANALQRLLA